MIDCKFAVRQLSEFVTCQRGSAACGFTCSLSSVYCADCDAKVPVGGVDAGLDCLSSRTLAPRCKQWLETRIMTGTAPRFADPNPAVTIDLPAIFEKFRAISTPDEQANLLKQAYLYQCALPEEDGGLSAEALAAEFEALAARFGLTDTLDQVVSAQEEAVNADAS